MGAESGGLELPDNLTVGVCVVPNSLQRGSSPPFLLAECCRLMEKAATLSSSGNGGAEKSSPSLKVMEFVDENPLCILVLSRLLFPLGFLSGVLVPSWVGQVTVRALQDIYDPGP